MTTEAQCLFGEVLKTFGTEGELLIKIIEESALRNELIKEPVFIKIDGLWVPFYFKLFELRGKKAKVIFENMESETLAEELTGKQIFIRSQPAPSKSDESKSELTELIGFTVKDSNLGVLGQVTKVFEFPGNPCVEIVSMETNILIPLNGIVRLDHRKKLIHTTIPDGL
ncbi:MAG: hypothetical protein LBR10_11710, partial [Prevotellaceae bacterium]|nr:hypothetical protein [Prevotellaceae bacterium]